ncbi:MAG: hypothetical protein DRH06_01855 [Deltaproteobacteria bacterium]|nr:MAG: hypothetical protein DRH06_01855 [Deltaproteobacteria bacterium]
MTNFSSSKSRASPFRNRHGPQTGANHFAAVLTARTSELTTKENIMKSRRLNRISKTVLSGLVLIALLAFSSGSAFASTAADTTIRNTVAVNYDDTAGNAQPEVTASADVTVNLVAATPTLSEPVDQTTIQATAAIYSYTITSNANGPDTYDLSEFSLGETAGINSSSSLFSVASIDLGASTVAVNVTILANTPVDIVVPSDLDGTDNEVNGIAAGDTVIIGTDTFLVNSVTDNGGVGTSIINVTTITGAFTANAGDLINEQGIFDLTVTPGTVTDSTTDQTITVVINAQDTNAAAAVAADETITTVQVPNLSVDKEVSTDGGATFALTAVANPGDTLTYRITVTNAGTSDADSVLITDPTPQFTLYTAGTAKSATATGAGYGDATNTVLTDAADADGYDFNITTGDTSTYSVGTVTAGSSVLLFFQVTIN